MSRAFAGALAAERLAERAALLLARGGTVLTAQAGGYAVRPRGNRRRRPVLVIDEAAFAVLARAPGLRAEAGGGWRLAQPPIAAAFDAAGRPGHIDGAREVVEPDGRRAVRRVNLGESPVAWLARRRDAAGRPWLSPREAAAGERLREDFQRAGTIGRLTMSWDAGPRAAGGRGPDPAERGRAARTRIADALAAVGPDLAPLLERVCLRGSALEAAERALGLPRRAGKTVLRLALARLADHYRLA